MLNTPRLTFALGERGDAPRSLFADSSALSHATRLHSLFAGSVWCLAALGNFKWNVLISIGRTALLPMGLVCAALPALRRKCPDAAAYRLPAGNFFAVLGIIFMVVLVSRMRLGEWTVILCDDDHCVRELALGAKPSLLGNLAKHGSTLSARFILTISNSCLYLKCCIESDFKCRVLYFQIWGSRARRFGLGAVLACWASAAGNKGLPPCQQEVCSPLRPCFASSDLFPGVKARRRAAGS